MQFTSACSSFALSLTVLLASGCAAGDPTFDETNAAALAGSARSATRPPFPRVRSWGTSVLAEPKIQPIVYAADPLKEEAVALVGWLATSTYWSDLTSEYGVGRAEALPPIVLTEPPPARLTMTEVEELIAKQVEAAQGKLHPDTIFAYYTPRQTTIVGTGSPFGPPPESCKQFGAMHATVASADGKSEYATAIMPRCEGYLGETERESLGVATTHELIEAATSPFSLGGWAQVDFAGSGWGAITGAEVSDLCKLLPPIGQEGTPERLTRSWSNRAASAGHDPCLPSSGAYFVAYPVIEGGAQTSAGMQPYTKAIAVEPGETVVVDVNLYAEAGVTGAWDVTAEVLTRTPQFPAPEGEITLSLERARAQAGDTLKLTVSRRASKDEWGPPGVPIVLRSKLEGRTNEWYGLVGY